MASIYQQFNFPSNETLNNNNQLLQDQVLSSDKVVKNLTAQFLQDDQKQLQPEAKIEQTESTRVLWRREFVAGTLMSSLVELIDHLKMVQS